MPANQCVCAEHGDSKSASRQDPMEQEANDNKMDNADGRSEQRHVVRADAGPEVHVDKAAGIVSIAGLPLGCRYITRGPCRGPASSVLAYTTGFACQCEIL